MSAETWGIVLRDCASGAEQWVACEVETVADENQCDEWRARTIDGHGLTWRSDISPRDAVSRCAESITNADHTLTLARIENPGECAAHMERVRSTLLRDEVERLRAERGLMLDAARRTHEAISPDTARLTWETGEALNRERPAEYAHLVAMLAHDVMARLRNETVEGMRSERDAAVRETATAFTRGAETMRAAVAKEIERWPRYLPVDKVAAIRALPLPAYAPSQPAQSHEATATPDAPLTIADAAARARSAAAQRAECDHRWVTTLDGLRGICMRCHETRLRSTVLR